MKKWLLAASLTLISGLVFFSCKKSAQDGDKPAELDRKPMLTQYADRYIMPGYTAMSGKLATLRSSAEDFTAAPTEATLTSLRTAWKDAYIAWQTVDLVGFGPAEDISLRMYMNTYPLTVSKVEGNISSGSYDLETFGNKDAQGFPALDYLLNGLGDNAAVLARYTTDPSAAASKQYLTAVIVKMQEKVNSVKDAWQGYRTTFTESTGTDVNSSLSRMVNAYVLYYERYLRSGKVGYPVGAMTGVASPEHTEAFYSPGLSKELALTALQSVIRFYEGKSYDGGQQGEGMKSYLAALGTKDDDGTLMADQVSQALQKAAASLQGLNTTIKDGVTNNRPAVLAIYEDLQGAVALLKVDMVSAFGISITYVDNDGD
jgi:predicted lipoprotein